MKVRNFLILSLAFLCSCAAIRRSGVNMMVPTFNEVMKAAYELNDAYLMKEALPSNIILLEGLVRISPENEKLLILTAQAYCSYALGFIEDHDPERAKKLYLRGRDYALRALAVNKRVRKLIKKKKVPKDAPLLEKMKAIVDLFSEEEAKIIRRKKEEYEKKHPGQTIMPKLTEEDYREIVKKLKLKKEDVAPFFWAGNCWGGWLNLSKTSPSALFDTSYILTFMKIARALDDKFFYGGPHLFFALYYSSLPPLLGGGPEKTKEEFEKVFKLTQGKFLLAKAFYARYYAALIKDEALFDKVIQEVLETPSDIDPELTLMNEIAKLKARIYKAQKKDLF